MCGVVSTLEALIERTVGGLGYELADFEYINNGMMLRVFIEKLDEVDSGPGQGGITVADCEAASRQLQRVLEVEGIAYDRLEVSSPGLDRRLRKAADFARFTGHEAAVRLRRPVNGRRNFTGTVRGVTGERVEIEFEGDRMAFDMAELDRARLVPKL
ncbi:MAG TPA: ribosome maturation factor RimP [Burkholderiales bacterium]|nr:ribosome maturation factor RimP [Burkholderiales bacterium]